MVGDMSASKICEPHTAVGEVHAAFAVLTSPSLQGSFSVCKDYLNRWLDYADNGVVAEPTGLRFLPEPQNGVNA
jgi:hypothetical protein